MRFALYSEEMLLVCRLLLITLTDLRQLLKLCLFHKPAQRTLTASPIFLLGRQFYVRVGWGFDSWNYEYAYTNYKF